MKKNYYKSILVSLMIISTLVLLVGCNTTSLSGTYYKDVNDARYYTFNEDGTCTLTDEDGSYNGTYTRDGRTISIMLDGANEARTGKVSGKKLTITENGYDFVYKK